MNDQALWDRAHEFSEKLKAAVNREGDELSLELLWKVDIPTALFDFAKHAIAEDNKAFYRAGASK